MCPGWQGNGERAVRMLAQELCGGTVRWISCAGGGRPRRSRRNAPLPFYIKHLISSPSKIYSLYSFRRPPFPRPPSPVARSMAGSPLHKKIRNPNTLSHCPSRNKGTAPVAIPLIVPLCRNRLAASPDLVRHASEVCPGYYRGESVPWTRSHHALGTLSPRSHLGQGPGGQWEQKKDDLEQNRRSSCAVRDFRPKSRMQVKRLYRGFGRCDYRNRREKSEKY